MEAGADQVVSPVVAGAEHQVGVVEAGEGE